MHIILQIRNIKRYFLALGIILMVAPFSFTLASEANSEELAAEKQRLQEILDEIGNARDKRAEQRALLEKLNQKMECNWKLIKDYESCSKQFEEQVEKEAACVKEAKESANTCLSKISPE